MLVGQFLLAGDLLFLFILTGKFLAYFMARFFKIIIVLLIVGVMVKAGM